NMSSNGTVSTYTVHAADESNLIRVQVSSQDADSSSTSTTSNATSAVTDVTPSLTPATIASAAKEGDVLTISGGVANDSDATLSYQWQSSSNNGVTWSNISSNGTGSTYTVQQADESNLIRVQVYSQQSDSSSTSTTSNATSAVTDNTPSLTPATIASAAKEGDVLSISGGVANDSDATLSYQWQSSSDNGVTWNNISSNGTGSTYTVQQADESNLIRVQVSSQDADSSSTSTTSNATSAVTDITPSLTPATIASAAKEGDVLTISGGVANDSDASLSYQWQSSSDNGVTWNNISSNGTGSTYTVQQADESNLIRVQVSSQDADSSSTSTTSNATSAVTDITPSLTPATIASAAKEGDVLSISGGVANDSDATLSYQWQSSSDNGVTWNNISSNGTGSTYTVQQADESNLIRVQVSSQDADSSSTSTTSNATSAVTDITPSLTPATIASAAKEGDVLTISGGVANDSDASLSYQWQSSSDNGVTWNNISSNGTGSTYTVQQADESNLIRVQVSSQDADSSSTSTTSNATSAVTDITPSLTPATIASAAKEGDVLSISGGVANDSDASLSYQWQSSSDNGVTWNNISSNGTGSTYTVQQADESNLIRVQVTPQDADSSSTSTTSNATSAVTDITPSLTSATIASAAKEGDVLSISGGVANDSDASLSYQWQSSSNNGLTWNNTASNGTGSSYTVQQPDESNLIRVQVTSQDADSSSTSTTSNATSAVTDITPSLTPATIASAAKEGDVLSISGGVANDSDATLSYQWQSSSDNGVTWNNIASNGTGSTYTVQQADESNLIRVQVSSQIGSGWRRDRAKNSA